MPKLTKRFVDALRPTGGRDRFEWDIDLKGFGIRMKPSGAASFILQYRTPQGRTRRYAFANVGTLAPEQARIKARRLLADAHDGMDPSRARHEAREALTIEKLCQRYMDAARAGLVLTRFRKPKALATVAIDEGRVLRHIVPLIGAEVANDIDQADVQRMYDSIAAGKTAKVTKTKARGTARVTGGAGTAARVVELLGGIWAWAEKRRLVTSRNPARNIDKLKTDAKDRVLSKGELKRLGDSIKGNEGRAPLASTAVRFIALTGLRRREEACGLRWREIDFDGQCLPA